MRITQTSLDKKPQRGFTMTELIVVIMIVGILAAFAAPRLFGVNNSNNDQFLNELRVALQYAQQSAVSRRRNVCTTFDETQVSFTMSKDFGGACTIEAKLPTSFDTPDQLVIPLPDGVKFDTVPGTLSFSPNGSVTGPTTIKITGSNRVLTINTGTGYVSLN